VVLDTSGSMDRLILGKALGAIEHAFLIPAGGGLPFPPRGPVFRVR
jgi:hypothetical protein